MKRLLLSAVLLSSIGLYAQVGINTEVPKASLEVVYDATQGKKVQAIGLPQMTTSQRNNFKYGDLKDGQMIYNKTSGCVEVWINKKWKCLSSTAGADPQPIDPNIPPVPENEANLGRNASVATIGDATTYVASLTYQGTPYQGVIDNNNNKITLKIPYTGGNGQNYAGVIATAQTEVGAMEGKPRVRKPIKMKVLPGRLSGNGFITAEITTDELFNVKRLPPDGTTVQKVAEFELKIGDKTQTVIVNAIGGIPDKHFEDADHKFIYLPVRVTGTVAGESYDETWLNFNLGADYANLNKRDEGIFNPAKVLSYPIDYHAYGSLFQFGRDGDGHELVNWDRFGEGSPAKNNIEWKSEFQLSYTPDSDPCPNGYRTPTRDELTKLADFVRGGTDEWSRHALKLPLSGRRDEESGMWDHNKKYYAYLWGSNELTCNDDLGFCLADMLKLSLNETMMTLESPAAGLGIRCIKKK